MICQIWEKIRARVIVSNQVEGSESRVVMCHTMGEAPTLLCSAQEAPCRCLHTLILEEDCPHGDQHNVRMLVPSDQVWAVLGKRDTAAK